MKGSWIKNYYYYFYGLKGMSLKNKAKCDSMGKKKFKGSNS